MGRVQNSRIFALDECVVSSERSGARVKTKSVRGSLAKRARIRKPTVLQSTYGWKISLGLLIQVK